MSNFTSRLNAIGEFEIGNGKFVVLDVKGGLIRCVQTHSMADGSLLPEFATSVSGGIATTPTTQFPTGFIVPQTHPAFGAVKTAIADLDSRVLTLCASCMSSGVTLGDMTNACDSCEANLATISYLKTV